MLRRPETKKVATFLYDLLVSNAPSKDYAKTVACRMDLPYASLARYWQGRAAFPAGLIRSLFLATDQDIRVAEFFLLEGSDYRLERVSSQEPVTDFSRSLILLNKLEGEVSGLYHEATRHDSDAGAHISFAEARDLADALQKLTRMAEQLREAIKALHPSL